MELVSIFKSQNHVNNDFGYWSCDCDEKLCLVIIIAFIFSMMYPSISFADSPITSTQFYTAYLDIEIVEKASEMTNIDEKTIKYLSDPEYPLDIKAAVINALGWEIEGRTMQRGMRILFLKSLWVIWILMLFLPMIFSVSDILWLWIIILSPNARSVLEKACEAFP